MPADDAGADAWAHTERAPARPDAFAWRAAAMPSRLIYSAVLEYAGLAVSRVLAAEVVRLRWSGGFTPPMFGFAAARPPAAAAIVIDRKFSGVGGKDVLGPPPASDMVI